MPAEAVITVTVQSLGTKAPLWFIAGLAAILVISAIIVVLAKRHLQRRSLQPTPSLMGLLLGYGLGFICIVMAALIFSFIADRIAADAAIGRLDILLAETLRQHATDLGYRIFGWITHFGDTVTLTILCATVAVVLLGQRQMGLALGWIAAIVGNSILNRTLKAVFERTRPLHEQALADGWSFPSGHTSGSVVAYGMLAYVLIRTVPSIWHLPVILMATAIAFSTGFSRVYLQVHYLSDVTAGFASGAAWLTSCILSIELARFYRNRRQRPRIE